MLDLSIVLTKHHMRPVDAMIRCVQGEHSTSRPQHYYLPAQTLQRAPSLPQEAWGPMDPVVRTPISQPGERRRCGPPP